MKKFNLRNRGFTLLEILVAVAVFLIFSIGVYSGINMIFKIVYQSRMRIVETSILSEELEIARNLPYDQVGIAGGLPAGALQHEKIIARNGKNFTIVTTVRNIDDPYDGTLGGAPNDASPADYKLVEISAICADCVQTEPEILNTIVSPKNLEGASQNGALFISVFDANGLPVRGANVHIVNSAPEPDLIIDDTTDNAGLLRVIDAPTGTLSYSIIVSKSGYSTDQTHAAVPEGATPAKPPSTVVSQTVTEISFAIDRLGNLVVKTMNPWCAAVGGAQFNLRGEKKIGTDPDVFKYNQNFSTDAGGAKNLAGMEWDVYHLSPLGGAYDVAGSIPMLPLNLTPGLNQELFVILRPHANNSLLVKAQDAGAQLPLANAVVRLFDANYDESFVTGLGYSRQTDWSGGSGQADYIFTDKYFADSGTLALSSPAGDIELKKAGNHYMNNGWLESSTIDFGGPVNFNNIIWEPLAQPLETGANSISFQLAASDAAAPAEWNFVGPDGATSTFYTSTTTLIWNGWNGKRYLRYKIFLQTADDSRTPTLSEIAITYTNSCIPPGQIFFNDLAAGSYNLEVSRPGYISNSGLIEVAGNGETTVNLSINE